MLQNSSRAEQLWDIFVSSRARSGGVNQNVLSNIQIFRKFLWSSLHASSIGPSTNCPSKSWTTHCMEASRAWSGWSGVFDHFVFTKKIRCHWIYATVKSVGQWRSYFGAYVKIWLKNAGEYVNYLMSHTFLYCRPLIPFAQWSSKYIILISSVMALHVIPLIFLLMPASINPPI